MTSCTRCAASAAALRGRRNLRSGCVNSSLPSFIQARRPTFPTSSGGSALLRACHQAGVDEREGIAEELRSDGARLDQLIDCEAADDGHHDASDVLCRHREVGRPEVARPGLHRGGQGAAKLRLALGVAGAKRGIADRKAPVLALKKHRLALLVELLGERLGRRHRHVALRRRRREQCESLAQGFVDALFEERREELLLSREMPVERSLRVARLGGDLVDASLAAAPACEDPQRRCQELVASLTALCASGASALIGTCGHGDSILTDQSVCTRSTVTLTFHWFLPTYGDSRHIVGGGHGLPAGTAGGTRAATLGYLGQIARSAEQLGFVGALTPTGAWCEDAWLSTAMLAEVTERLKFLVAFRPGLVSPTLAAQMAATYQRHSHGRLLLNVVVGGEAHEQRAYGDFLDKDARYGRASEFLEINRRLWRGETVDHHGEHLHVEGAELGQLPDPAPPIYFGGSSAAAGPVAVRHADVYLTWGEPPPQVAEKLAWIRELGAAAGRTPRFGIRLHVIARDSSEQAWAEAQRLLDGLDPALIRDIQAGLARSESVGQRRMLALHGGTTSDLEIYPNLWAGVGLVRGGAGTALVGSHTEVADLIGEYAALGIDEFILSGHPHLEEAYWFAEGVLPILRERGLWRHPFDEDEDEAGPGTGVPFATAATRAPEPAAS